MRNYIKLGVEIETVLNYTKNSFNIGDYHRGIKKGKFWKLERDNSIRTRGEFEYGRGCEFISKIARGEKSFFKMLEEFKTFFNGSLDKNICFNSSCGCHLHIGLSNNKKYYDKIDFRILKQMRKRFFKLVQDSKVLNENIKERVLNNYFREYAKKNTENTSLTTRNQEFNFSSELGNKGLEWRSFNLCGVKSWAEFDEMFKIGWDCIRFLFKRRVNGYKLSKESTKLNDKILNEKMLNSGFKDEIIEFEDLNKNIKEDVVLNV